jgi:hypothetical protein
MVHSEKYIERSTPKIKEHSPWKECRSLTFRNKTWSHKSTQKLTSPWAWNTRISSKSMIASKIRTIFTWSSNSHRTDSSTRNYDAWGVSTRTPQRPWSNRWSLLYNTYIPAVRPSCTEISSLKTSYSTRTQESNLQVALELFRLWVVDYTQQT